MESKEIVAYLKGAINLGKIKSLSANEVQAFKNLLKNQKSEKDCKEKEFCSWLCGYFDALETQDVPAEKFVKIAQKVGEIENNRHTENFNLGERLPGGAIAKC